MVVTVNTDASYHPYFKVGAWAFYIVCDQGKITRAGPCKQVHNAHDAEVQAIGNALYAILMSNFRQVKYIVVNTDCQNAILAIQSGIRKGKAKDRLPAIHRYISALRIKYHIKAKRKRKSRTPFIDYRYVKAHVDIETKRQWVNDFCDKAAKAELDKQIQIIKNERSAVPAKQDTSTQHP